MPKKEEKDDLRAISSDICDNISRHVSECKTCQRRLSFDPIEKALLKTHSVKNEIMELIAYIVTGIVLIVALHLISKVKMR